MQSSEAKLGVRWWSATASLVLAVFVVVGVALLATGRDRGAIVCLALGVVYVPLRLVRRRLIASGTVGRHG